MPSATASGSLYSPPPTYSAVPPNDRGQQESRRGPTGHHATTPTHYRTGETEPLLGGDGSLPPKPSFDSFLLATRGHKRNILLFLLAIMIGFMYARNSQRWENTIYDPMERERIRTEWELEIHKHTEDMHRMQDEREEIQRQWHSDHMKEREKTRKEWELEVHEHSEDMHRMQDEREEMQRQWHSDHMKLVELRRDIEFENKRLEAERRELDEERRRWDDERQKRESEERERQRMLIQWGTLQQDEECVRYGVARYQASLEYVPLSWDPYVACQETPIRIHQKDVYPTECRHTGSQMVGIWMIDFDEPACKPWWTNTKDGCTGHQSGIHRYEAHLEGYLESKEYKTNWAEMCSTTPHSMLGQTYDSPTECVYSPKIGVYGLWDIPDGNCS